MDLVPINDRECAGFFITPQAEVFAHCKKGSGLRRVKTRYIKGYESFHAGRRPNCRNTITKKVHRCLALTFIGPPPFEGALVRHLNDKKYDNSIGNLAWGTTIDNTKDAITNGVMNVPPKGDAHPKAKLSGEDVIDIRKSLANGESGKSLALKYGVSRASITLIKQRKNWSHI